MAVTVHISREHLNLDVLEISDDRHTAERYWLGRHSTLLPVRMPRRPRDPHAIGRDLRADMTAQPRDLRLPPLLIAGPLLPLVVYAQGLTADCLWAARNMLTAALMQPRYTITICTTEGSRTWHAGPDWPHWTPITGDFQRTKLARATLTIPVTLPDPPDVAVPSWSGSALRQH